ncbi:RagB/SusD family nutrient uptake outer membrane protein [Echinicola strongylocentroti]|uniref:RagB/SusD family nutrient uptake outer membrane protein n=1 Tax=Echinicola strongylocentroti TaxID=1795355 RepID=A0A2Z4IPH5_9BACT|nr:RagB/SusD family nutrient uptake outer membrane protein [Echinicola strongylocentroti]AWW32694.1 RagB/SusD family nutrient uptake outer membrane protein [Echinicola strongylocentroti]
MQKINKLYIIVLLLGLFSCEEFLDVSPDFGIDEDDVFSEYESTRGYLDNCYDVLYDVHHWRSQNLQRTHISGLSDEGGTLFNGAINTLINTGSWIDKGWAGEIGWTGQTNYDQGSIISNAFFAIRIANKVITNVGQMDNLSQAQHDELLGQAYFFRAWYYFQIIQRWGGMPIFDKAYTPSDDLDLPRVTYSESTEWLIGDLNNAIALLPHKWDDNQVGRITKAAAMSVKSMAALYAASPLMQNDLTSIQYRDYGQEWTERAAAYAHEVIEYVSNGTGGTRFRLMNGEEYKNIFYHEGINVSDESLFYNLDAGRRHQSRGLRCNYLPQRFSGGTGNDATAYSNPTQNIVDMYEVLNGGQAYPVDDPRSGYDPQNPYVNRDPRFYNNIIVPGEEWGVDNGGRPIYQELYVGGTDYNIQTTSNHTRNRQLSGYMCKKFIWPEANRFTSQYGLYRLNNIFIRVSQVYLDYAEAMNEAYGPNSDPNGYGLTAVQAVNMIRNRVGMPDVLTEHTGSKETFRDAIRHERAVELMWENHRWHDLRRWMVAEDVFSRPIQGVRAYPPAGHQSVQDKSTLDFTYEVIELETEQRVFGLRNHWYPVAQSDAQNLFNFQQNPGW